MAGTAVPATQHQYSCEVLAIGSELLLGQVVDTNSAWIGERLASAGISCFRQVKVGDNHRRIAEAVRAALEGAEAVICCGGLGPTQDDITRGAIAEVMGVPLRRHADLEEGLRLRFAGRRLPAINLKQADVPDGATVIAPSIGTAPGLICPVGDKVVYAVPGVPAEMKEMVDGAVVPDLVKRSGQEAVVRSRALRVWGMPESQVAELVAPRLEALEGTGTTIAFLASVSEGVRVRVTTRSVGPDASALAGQILDDEEARLRELLGDAVGGVDDDGLEATIARLLKARSWRLGVAESLTGGLVASRLTSIPGASEWFAGGVVSYAADVKRALLGVSEGPVVSEKTATEMALGVARSMGAEVGLSLTGVAGPATQEGQPVGTVFVGVSYPGTERCVKMLLAGGREIIRQRAGTNALDLLRRSLSS